MTGIVFDRPICQECGARSSRLSAPFLCEEHAHGPTPVPTLAEGEAAWIVRAPGFWPTGPIRDRELAERLALLWGGVVEAHEQAPALHRVGRDLVSV